MSHFNEFKYTNAQAVQPIQNETSDRHTVQLLQSILSELKNGNLSNKDLWKIDDIAKYCSCSLAPAYIIVKNRNFPRPIRLPTSSNGSGGRRWVAKEVMAYLKGCK